MPATYLKLHAFAGQRIEEGFDDATRIASTLGVCVLFHCNGVDVLACPLDNPRVLEANWRAAMDRGVNFASANIVARAANEG